MKLITDVLQPFRRLYSLLPVSSRGGLISVALVAGIAAVFETISVASILPFMAIVMNPDVINDYVWLKNALAVVGVTSRQSEIVTAGLLTILVLALGNSINALNLWTQTRYVANTRRILSGELYAGYMQLPYSFHVQRDTASLLQVISGDVESALGGFLASLLGVFSRGLSGAILITLIVFMDPTVAVGAVVVLGGGYSLVYRLIRVRQSVLGERMVSAMEALGRTGLEGLAGVKELRVLGRESTSSKMYNESLMELASVQTSNTLATALPRYVIEVFAYAGIVSVTLFLVLKGEATTAMPSLALYALAGNRLAPIFQQLFAAAITIKYHTRAVDALENDLAEVRNNPVKNSKDSSNPLSFKQEIRLRSLGFSYPSATRPSLSEISVVIPQNQSVGLVGKTGSGKTTLADIILALYPPSVGSISIDGVEMTLENERAWRKRVGYVPQHVFLTNASVAQNIALGIAPHEIDLMAVRRAAEMAQATEFIDQLPLGYETVVGERGVKLSGGQRQRLGIARALYHSPDVLVFDEATSALDGMTEDAVMQAVESLSSERTMILIAHRLRTVQACDRIIMLDSGKVVADGCYDDLMLRSEPFQRLAGQINHREKI